MSDYNYIIGSLFGLAVFIIILGNLGGASDIYGDDFVVVDTERMEESEIPTDYDFDIDRIRFTPNLRVPEGSEPLGREDLVDDTGNIFWTEANTFVWNGNAVVNQSEWSEFSADGTSYAYAYADAQFNVSERDDNQIVNLIGGDEPVYIALVDLVNGSAVNQTISRPAGTDETYNFDLSGDRYDGIDEVDILEIIVVDEETQVDLSGVRQTGDGVVGFANSAISFLQNSFAYLSEFVSMIVGYIAFTTAVPGILGSVLRLYVGIFFLVFVVKEFWIG